MPLQKLSAAVPSTSPRSRSLLFSHGTAPTVEAAGSAITTARCCPEPPTATGCRFPLSPLLGSSHPKLLPSTTHAEAGHAVPSFLLSGLHPHSSIACSHSHRSLTSLPLATPDVAPSLLRATAEHRHLLSSAMTDHRARLRLRPKPPALSPWSPRCRPPWPPLLLPSSTTMTAGQPPFLLRDAQTVGCYSPFPMAVSLASSRPLAAHLRHLPYCAVGQASPLRDPLPSPQPSIPISPSSPPPLFPSVRSSNPQAARIFHFFLTTRAPPFLFPLHLPCQRAAESALKEEFENPRSLHPRICMGKEV